MSLNFSQKTKLTPALCRCGVSIYWVRINRELVALNVAPVQQAYLLAGEPREAKVHLVHDLTCTRSTNRTQGDSNCPECRHLHNLLTNRDAELRDLRTELRGARKSTEDLAAVITALDELKAPSSNGARTLTAAGRIRQLVLNG